MIVDNVLPNKYMYKYIIFFISNIIKSLNKYLFTQRCKKHFFLSILKIWELEFGGKIAEITTKSKLWQDCVNDIFNYMILPLYLHSIYISCIIYRLCYFKFACSKIKNKKMAENWRNLAENMKKKIGFCRTRRTRFLQLWFHPPPLLPPCHFITIEN